MAGIYIHIPFCKQACHYCDFHFSTRLDTKPSLIEAMIQELILKKKYLNEPIRTLYFGGGTPSILDHMDLERFFLAVSDHYDISLLQEITLEANPDDLTSEKLKSIKQLGINRLSIGIQSFNDKFLKLFNRAHNALMAKKCVLDAKNIGFENISVDLIFGAPNQEMEEFSKDLDAIIEIDVPHVSIYGLTIEGNTAFGRWHTKGQLIPLEEDLAARQFEMTMQALEKAGYEQYEISNFGKRGFRSMHNSSYWRNEKYLGIGPSAHSYDGNSREQNIRNNIKYIKSLARNKIPCKKELLSNQDKINEMLLIQLRLAEGLDIAYLKRSLGYDLLEDKDDELARFIKHDQIVLKDNRLKLTNNGKLIADYVTERLLPNSLSS